MRQLILVLVFCGACGEAPSPSPWPRGTGGVAQPSGGTGGVVPTPPSSGGTGGAAPSPPREYVLLADDRWMADAGGGISQAFELRAQERQAVVKYALTDRSTTTPDHWDLGIFSAAELVFFKAGQPARSQLFHAAVSSISDQGVIAAGSWALAGRCVNVVERCQASVDLSVTY